ncbi:uncharacterized protein LOC142574564 [Dermacentor variabilis]|uniref:uncharacterized protein LOC142574564 n=1 Tax=Dermacentor variabilis TaxID=34621 RepID=UPI003F5C6313
MEIERLYAIGKELGMTGAELKRWIDIEIVRERDQRAQHREDAKAQAQEAEAQAEQERLRLEAEERVLKLKIELQEKTAAVQSAQSDSTTEQSVTRAAPQLFSPHKLIPPFNEARDDLDAYLQRFERVATSQEWPRAKWALSLSLCLTGEALTVIGRLDSNAALDYDQLKATLLQRFRCTAEGYREKFRNARPEDNETGLQYAGRISGYFDHWLGMSHIERIFDSLRDTMIAEQFLSRCSASLRVFLKERNCNTLAMLSKNADCFIEAQNLTNLGREKLCKEVVLDSARKNEPPTAMPRATNRCFLCDKAGHRASECWSRTKENSTGRGWSGRKRQGGEASRRENQGQASCILAPSQAEKPTEDGGGYVVLQGGETVPIVNMTLMRQGPRCDSGNLPVGRGFLESQPVSVLRDTGCNTVVVRLSLVPEDKMTGTKSPVFLLDLTIHYLPEAIVYLESPFFTGVARVKCMRDPLYDVVLGNIEGARAPDDPANSWAPLKHNSDKTNFPANRMSSTAQAELPDAEGQTLSTAKYTAASSGHTEDYESDTELVAVTKEMKIRSLPTLPVSPSAVTGIEQGKLKALQRNDGSLSGCFEKVGKIMVADGRASEYYLKDDILYRKHTVSGGKILDQLVVPKDLRGMVMKLAHEGILAGHQGVTKTVDRIVAEFYWPGVQSETKRFVKSCDVCQRTVPRHLVGRAPLGTMPVIDTPFARVGIDIIGPLSPTSDKGNRYILTMVDFATRYPDAVALSSTESRTVAEGLVEMFSRVGLPREIVSDRGSYFMSAVMKEFSRLLSIKQLPTTPYHPMANGLVERFNGTLKRALGRMCQERPKCWVRYLGPLLFAYREVPQSSIGYSPFELLYGRYVRGPMAVLKELWTNPRLDNDMKSSYEYIMELRQRLERTCAIATQELTKAKQQQKTYYDRKAKMRELNPGDKVLVLLPGERNKLILMWKGPFNVVERQSPLDYVVDLGSRTTVFHINMLKKYEERPNSELLQVTATTVGTDDATGLELAETTPPYPSLIRTQTSKDVVISNQLTMDQRLQVEAVLTTYDDIFSDLPGKTDVLQCHLELTTTAPIQVRQYPMPFAVRNAVEKEVQDMLKVRTAKLTIKPNKSEIGSPTTCFLGHVVGQGVLQPLKDTANKINTAKRPGTKKELRAFLGLTGYYRDFVPNYAELAHPLTDLTKKGSPNRLNWQTPHEEAFMRLKELLSQQPILKAPDLSRHFVLRTDASSRSLGAILLQEHDGRFHPVSYASRKLLPREAAYSTIERECLAIVWAVQKFHVYLYEQAGLSLVVNQPAPLLGEHPTPACFGAAKPSERSTLWRADVPTLLSREWLVVCRAPAPASSICATRRSRFISAPLRACI